MSLVQVLLYFKRLQTSSSQLQLRQYEIQCNNIIDLYANFLVGPTAILSLLTGAFIRRDVGDPGEWAALLCFFAGCFQLTMGILRLGTWRKALPLTVSQ